MNKTLIRRKNTLTDMWWQWQVAKVALMKALKQDE
jgi:hypothetical protein